MPGKRLILSQRPRPSDPISVPQSALTLQTERLPTELKETQRRSAGLHSSDEPQVSGGLSVLATHLSLAASSVPPYENPLPREK